MKELAIQQPELIGRESELSKLKQSLDNAIAGKGSTIFIAGEAGIGKTRLVSELINDAGSKGTQIIQGWCLAESLESLLPIKAALREAGLFHLISGAPPPLLLSVYLMNEAGILIAKCDRRESGRDPYLFASMLKAVGSFVKDSMQMAKLEGKKSHFTTLGQDEFKILVEEQSGLYLATVVKGEPSEFLLDDMRETLIEIQKRFGELLSTWDGDIDKVRDIEPIVSRLITNGKYDGKFLVDDPNVRQENVFDNVLLGIHRLSSEKPLLLSMDDLQWADPSTLSLLHYISKNTKHAKVLIIGTYRSEEIVPSREGNPHQLTDAMQKMSRDDLLTTYELNRLDFTNTKSIIEACLGKTSLNQKLLDKIFKETEGNPFFILEVVKLLVEDKALMQDEDGVWVLATEVEKIDLPSKVYDVVKRRLDRLIDEQREMLECASVIGEEFSTDILQKTTELQKVTLLKNLSKIEKTHKLIHYLKDKYRFDHAKIREVLYNGISEELRKEYHKIIADTIMEIHKENLNDVVGELAYHFYEGGDERAGIYIMKSGDIRWTNKLEEIKKMAKKDDYLKEILKLNVSVYFVPSKYNVSMLVKEMEDAGISRIQIIRYFRVMVFRNSGVTLEFLGVTPDKNEIVVNMVFNEKSEYTGYSYVLSEKDLNKIEQYDDKIPALEQLNNWLKSNKQWLEHVEKQGNKRGIVHALVSIGWVHYFKEEYNAALEFYQRGLTISQELGDDSIHIENLYALADVQAELGDYTNAIINAKKAVALAVETHLNSEEGISRLTLGTILRRMKEWDKAKEEFDLAQAVIKGEGFEPYRTNYEYGLLYKDQGKSTKAKEYLEKALSGFERIGMTLWADKCKKALEEINK